MIWNYTYTPYIWPSVFVALLLFGLFVFSWQRRDIPGALPFAVVSIFGTLWVGASAMQLAAVDVPTQIFWYKVQAESQLPSITAITVFLLEFIWPRRFLTRRNLILLFVPILLLWGTGLTNPYHHLAWKGFTVNGTVVPIRGPMNWALIAYGLALGMINVIVLVWLFIRSPQHRWLALIMLLSLGFTRAVYLLVTAGQINTILPINALANVIPLIVYSVALFRFRILDPVPLAQQMALEQLNAGMLILDPLGKIISANPASAAIFKEPSRQLIGQQIQHLLPEWPGLMENPPPDFPGWMKIHRKTSAEIRHYQLESSTLTDWRGLKAGHLLLLQDITQQEQAQAQLLEQQQAVAALKEREQIARELHDELSQELALINVQAQVVAGLLETGQEEKAREQLLFLAKVARNTQVDVRGQIRQLLLSAEPSEDFLTRLYRFVDWFQNTNSIETELNLADSHSNLSLPPTVEVQLSRIVQEAFTNIHKHARASKVSLTLQSNADRLKLLIEDDGVGFDLNQLPASGSSFGLGIMSARAEDIGGSVALESAPGQGTRIIVVVPYSEKQTTRNLMGFQEAS